MLRRRRVEQAAPKPRRIGLRLEQVRGLDAIAFQGPPAAVEQPTLDSLAGLDEVEQHRLVVALQMNAFEAGQRRADQRPDDATSVRAAVQVIAEIDDDPTVRWAAAAVYEDSVANRLQQVRPAVNVADGINPHAVGKSVDGAVRVRFVGRVEPMEFIHHVWQYGVIPP